MPPVVTTSARPAPQSRAREEARVALAKTAGSLPDGRGSDAIKRRRGFTLLEILIVVAVIAILIAIAVPALSHVKTIAKKAAVAQQLSGLDTALGTYYTACTGTYPPSEIFDATGTIQTDAYGTNVIKAGRGAALLAEGLTGYLPGTYDGAGAVGAFYGTDSGPFGFRMHGIASLGTGTGARYGPYGPTDPKVLVDNNPSTLTPAPAVPDSDQSFVDAYGNEILYFRSTRAVSSTTGLPVVTQVFGTNPLANDYYFYADANKLAADQVTARTSPALSSAGFFKTIGAPANSLAGVSANVTGHDSFLLISAGPDGVYFTADDIIGNKP